MREKQEDSSVASIRRNKTEVTMEILDACRTPKIISSIAREANLSGNVARAAVNHLVSIGLLEAFRSSGSRSQGGAKYVCTTRAYEVLGIFREINKMLRP